MKSIFFWISNFQNFQISKLDFFKSMPSIAVLLILLQSLNDSLSSLIKLILKINSCIFTVVGFLVGPYRYILHIFHFMYRDIISKTQRPWICNYLFFCEIGDYQSSKRKSRINHQENTEKHWEKRRDQKLSSLQVDLSQIWAFLRFSGKW